MGRSSGKEFKKKKAKNAAKSKPAKGSKFSIHHNDTFVPIKHNSNAVAGNPFAYLYGKQANDAKKAKKKRSGDNKNHKKKNGAPNFAARKGDRRGKRLFIARFPLVDAKSRAVPWSNHKAKRQQQQQQQQQQHQKQQPRKLLNGSFSVDASAMDRLNEELQHFAAYVRLTPNEERAREYLVQRVRNSCQRLFGVNPDQCQVFGSFAAKAVCIFESDIDMAIWGVVPPGDDENNDRHRPNLNQSTGKCSDQASGSNRKKQDRVMKWKALIDNATKSMVGEETADDGEIGSSDDNDKPSTVVVSSEDTGNSTEPTADSSSSAAGDTGESTEPPPLFVLDRIGDSSGLDDLEIGATGPPKDGDDCGEEDRDGHRAVEDNNSSSSSNVDDNNSESASSQIDTVDKMDEFWSRKRRSEGESSTPANETGSKNNPIAFLDDETGTSNNPIVIVDRVETNDDDDDDSDVAPGEEKIDLNFLPKRRPRGQSLISLSSDTTCSVEAKLDESGMEVSFVVDPTQPSANNGNGREKTAGPSGNIRTRVVKALYQLTKPLRSWSSKLHVRKKARVPIINLVSHFGFECDIALGGHNGTDTSSYARNQLERFESFSTLVVFLKVLLNQQGLDKPFTGGLGSYSLYVMVASHIEQHLSMGGEDDPAEVLYTFFFRYGGVRHSNSKKLESCRTHLSQDVVLRTDDGGMADMKPCFQIENCITVFEACWRMLHKRVKGSTNPNFSVLQYMVDAAKLKHGRNQCKQQAEGKLREVLGGRLQSDKLATSSSFPREKTAKKQVDIADLEARQLIEGYGQDVEQFLPAVDNVNNNDGDGESPSNKKRKATRSKKKKRQKSNSSKPVHAVS